jgi:hypothetical protein
MNFITISFILMLVLVFVFLISKLAREVEHEDEILSGSED